MSDPNLIPLDSVADVQRRFEAPNAIQDLMDRKAGITHPPPAAPVTPARRPEAPKKNGFFVTLPVGLPVTDGMLVAVQMAVESYVENNKDQIMTALKGDIKVEK